MVHHISCPNNLYLLCICSTKVKESCFLAFFILMFILQKSLFGCANTEETVQQVYDSIKTIIHHSLEGVKEKKKQIELSLQCNERLHAAIFFRTLRYYFWLLYAILLFVSFIFYTTLLSVIYILFLWPYVNLFLFQMLKICHCDLDPDTTEAWVQLQEIICKDEVWQSKALVLLKSIHL